MQKPSLKMDIEPRWPVGLAVLAVVLLLALLPGRVRVVPGWVPFLLGLAIFVPMAAVPLTGGKAGWLNFERRMVVFFCAVMVVGTTANLMILIVAMVRHSTELSGLQLFTSSIAVWFTNVLIFSLLYWQIDRGGPETRVRAAGNGGAKPDWLFPQEGAPPEDVPPGWKPTFVDYLFLAYSTATAFSTTDVMPLTSRAKLLMMIESTIALGTIVVVAARAINILGG